MTGGMGPKRKGYEFERTFVNYMKASGLPCRRVPLSGAGEEKGDVVVQPGCMPSPLRGELKRRKKLPALFSALGDHDFLAFRCDRGETLIVLRLDMFRDLIQ